MKRLVVDGIKNTDGQFVKKPSTTGSSDTSIESIMKDGLTAIRRIMNRVMSETADGRIPTKDTVLNLEKCMTMLQSLRKADMEAVAKMTEAELELLLK